ncbi:unnamed protein product [Cylindrotheca closterium]|uniref:Uncharacterized protein n=1 Tax=Cylindrotheca closterium TaxID=2856 RepID=A0AAD2CL92_9STRA|nr:unnamed protein product [Cylindrotheca closterium]
MLQRNESVNKLDVQAIIALALDLTTIVLLIMAVKQMEAFAMETLAMAIDNLALVSLILATRIKDSRMMEIVIHQDLQTIIKEDQVATTKTCVVLEIKLRTTDLQETLSEAVFKIIIMLNRISIKKWDALFRMELSQ